MASPTGNTPVQPKPNPADLAADSSQPGPPRSPPRSPPIVMHPPPRRHAVDWLLEMPSSSDDDEMPALDETDACLQAEFASLFDSNGSDCPERLRDWLPCLPPLARELHTLTLADLPADAMLRCAADKAGQGMEVTAIDTRYGRSVLHWACMLAHPDLVVWLLRQGGAVHLNLPDVHGFLPIGCAHALRSLPGTDQVLDALLSAGATLDALPHNGAKLLYRTDLSVSVVRKLLRAGVDVNGGGAFESTPLVAGCGSMNWGAASLLLDHHADVHRRGPFGLTVLHNPRLPVWLAEQFHRRGADVNATDMLGETPLMLACAQGNLPLVRWLVAKGARPDAVADDGRSVIEHAAMGGQRMIDCLAGHG